MGGTSVSERVRIVFFGGQPQNGLSMTGLGEARGADQDLTSVLACGILPMPLEIVGLPMTTDNSTEALSGAQQPAGEVPLGTELAVRVHCVRDQRVILDHDLARVFGIEPRALNQSVKRSQDRFPEDFVFELTREEIQAISQSTTSGPKLKLPKQVRAFSARGALMAASVVNTPQAVGLSQYFVRSWVKMRELPQARPTAGDPLAGIEKNLLVQNGAACAVYELLKPLLEPALEAAGPEPSTRSVEEPALDRVRKPKGLP